MNEPLVFLPTMMSDARLFGPQIAALSSDTPVMAAPVTQGERVEEIASMLLDVLPVRFALAGLGLGGIVAMEVLRRAPDRVTRLALMGTHPLADTPQDAAMREPQIVKVRTGQLAEVWEREINPAGLAPGPHRREVLDLVMDMADVLGSEVYVRQSRSLQRRRDQQATLRQCQVPTLVVCGAHDTMFPPKRHAFMAELIPGAALHVLEDAAHFLPLEQPDVLTGLLRDWLRTPSAGPR